MNQLEVSAPAQGDLDGIWLHIAADNIEAADRHIERLAGQYASLARNPMIGRSRDDLLQGTRSFPLGNYVIFYQPHEDGAGVTIMRVVEGHRDITPKMFLD
jgi:toxin ParE1/3/4